MSLKVWLPLNGDLKNLGCSDIIATNNGATVDNNGKIGKCYSFDGADDRIYANNVSISNQEMSACCWVKFNNLTNNNYPYIFALGSNVSGTSIQLGLAYWKTDGKLHLVGHGSETASTYAPILNTWTHLCITIKGNQTLLYVNGVLNSTITNANSPKTQTCLCIGARPNSTAGAGTAISYPMNCCLNDFRIYDHCLSALEIKEISQGLVLHYKLDGDTQQNILTSTSSQTKTISSTGTSVYTSYWYIDEKYTSAMTEGALLTVEYDYSVNDVTETTSYLYSQFNTTRVTPHESLDYSTLTATTLGHHKWTFKVTAAQADYATTAQSRIRIRLMSSNPGASFTISNIRLYFGEEKNQIADSSGYRNDGEIVGNTIIQSNSPKFNMATYLNSSSPTTNNDVGLTYIHSNFGLTAPIQMSVCWWAKPENGYGGTTNHAAWCTSINSSHPTDYNSTAFHHRDAKFDICLNLASTTSLSLTFNNYTKNEWHYYCVTYDGKIAILYKDGVETNRSTISSTEAPLKTFTNIFIGYSRAGGVWRKTLGSYSDFRIYVTALSAEDIKKLYQTPIEIDKSNKLHSFEFDENATNDIELFGGRLWTSSYGQKILNSTNMFINYNTNGEPTFSGFSSAGSEYIKIEPGGKTYYYDTEVSIAAGNQFYIGIERYDVDKTPRSNNACVYIVSQKPSTDLVRKRFFGTVNLATDGTNTTDTISLRVLNKWSGSTSDTTGTATIHYLSLREITGNPQVALLKKTGQVLTSEFTERDDIVYFYKNGFIGSSEMIER